MKNASLLAKVQNLPRRPGIYIYKNVASTIIYIGKAKSLKDRVKSYFVLDIPQGSKTAALVSQVHDLDFIEVENEFDALILESNLIKKYRPKYNIQLKDDKSSLYIVIRNERVKIAGKLTKLPKIVTSRETDLLPSDTSFGPYTQGKVAQIVLRYLRKMYPFRDCSTSKFQRYNKLQAPCFYGHIGLCTAPCLAKVSIADYRKDIKRVAELLRGESKSVILSLEKEMIRLSKAQDFEAAAKKRDLVQRIKYVAQTFRDPEEYIDNPFLIEDMVSDSLDELVVNLPHLTKIPSRIECYDISNTSGKDATGSMVVATDGRLDTNEYRKFKIRFKTSPDDFEMMREVLTRRFKKDWSLPELLVVDGGKGQVSAAFEILKNYPQICLIGLAKKQEIIVLPDFTEIVLSRTNPALKLLQRLRDESHRFAKNYHMKLRLQKFIEN
ncbi:GIY-YIG nuclease family protein [candidate division WWE3 bacterium]|nr:GIY-YIG nuclease family protein [candidate division WWE3 bacterium]